MWPGCFRNYISGNYITEAKAHTGQSLPAAGVPKQERVLGSCSSRNLELCLKKKAWPVTGPVRGRKPLLPSLRVCPWGRRAGGASCSVVRASDLLTIKVR